MVEQIGLMLILLGLWAIHFMRRDWTDRFIGMFQVLTAIMCMAVLVTGAYKFPQLPLAFAIADVCIMATAFILTIFLIV